METARQGRGLIISAIKAYMKGQDDSAAQAEITAGTETAIPWANRMVLPPFLGEMGFEIRYLLAAIEPWLRNGWRILAKRPELYPDGTAFRDQALFDEMAAILSVHQAHAVAGAVRLPSEGVDISLKSAMVDGLFVVSATANSEADRMNLLGSASLEVRLRQAFARRYLQAPRPITPWDANLLTSYDSRPEHLCGGALSLAPGYKPSAFLTPPYPAQPHVGVQMRRLSHAADRDSDPDTVLAKAQEAAAYLGLPLLVYGHPDGTFRPEGLPNTAALAGDRPLLRYELSMLSHCRLMFAPESGWCDLMCWLQVPTLLEKLGRPHEFTHNAVFRPRLALLDPAGAIGPQIDTLLAAGQSLPVRPHAPVPFDDMDWDAEWFRHLNRTYIHGV